MIFHDNRLLADDSHEISCFILVEYWEKMSQNLSSAAVVIGALRVNVKEKTGRASNDFRATLIF